MLSGTYVISADTPLGRKSGTVTLKETESGVSAELMVARLLHETCSGTVDGNAFRLEGSMKNLLLGRQNYVVEGFVEGDVLTATVTANAGTMTVTGTRA